MVWSSLTTKFFKVELSDDSKEIHLITINMTGMVVAVTGAGGNIGSGIAIEVGRVVAFLLSDHATIIRGQSISIDGGDTAY